MTPNGVTSLRQKLATAARVVAIPLSLWCFTLANHAVFPSRMLRALLGPQQRSERTSAPDYMMWDIATMVTMLAICGASALYLTLQLIKRVRSG